MGKRLFISVDLDGLAEAVATVQSAFEGASGLTLTDPDQAHLTVKFLGDTDESRVTEIVDAVEGAVAESGVEPFTAEFGGLGVFPSLDYISVVWLGVRQGSEELNRLHETIEDRTVAIGFDPEDHEFTPHVTLARMEHAGGKALVKEVVSEQDPTVGTLRVDDVRVTESRLTHDGPAYTTVEAIQL